MIRTLLVSTLVVTVLACSGAPTPVATTPPPSPSVVVSPAPEPARSAKGVALGVLRKEPRYGCRYQLGGKTIFATIDGLDENGKDAAMLAADGQDRKLVMTGNDRIGSEQQMVYSGGGYSVSYRTAGGAAVVLTISGPGGTSTADVSLVCKDGGPLG